MKYDFIEFFEEKLKELAKCERVLDVGGGRPFQKRMAPYKAWFAGKKFETLDISPVYEPTIIGDVHAMQLPDESVDAILSLSVLEHLHDPAIAMKETHRVLRKGGKLLLYTHFIYPYHARTGIYKDYFRFTEEGLRHLFREFSNVELKKQGGYFRALGFFLPFQARLKWLWEPIAYFFDKVLRTEKRSTTPGYYIYAVK